MFSITGCATVGNLLKLEKPNVDVDSIKIVAANFEGLDIVTELNVKNNYPLKISLPGFNFNFMVNDISFLKGQEELNQTIGANAQSKVKVPLKIDFVNLYNTFKSFKDQDNFIYNLMGNINISLPVIGSLEIPFQKKGDFPLLKLPKIDVSALKVNKLTFTKADLTLDLNLKNPNAFFMLLKNMQYNFSVNGKEWVAGLNNNEIQIGEKGESLIKIPISLKFSEMGKSLFNILRSRDPLQYDFTSNLEFGTSLPILNNVKIPISRTGEVNLLK